MHTGLQKFFRNLSIATKKVEARKEEREKLSGYLRKIKIVSSKTAKKSVISSEIEKLEKHLSDLLDQKFKAIRQSPSIAEKTELEKLKEKEKELNEKISRLNELLAQVGKKVDEKKFAAELESEEKPSEVTELEDKLYTLESKYYQLLDMKGLPQEALDRVKDKISDLKEKIREAKNR